MQEAVLAAEGQWVAEDSLSRPQFRSRSDGGGLVVGVIHIRVSASPVSTLWHSCMGKS